MLRRLFLIVLTGMGVALAVPADVQVYFSPNGGCADAVKSHIRGAHRSLDVAIYTLTRPDVASVIDSASRRGIRVRVVMDRDQAQSQYSSCRPLVVGGVPVRLGSGSGLLHDKFAVIDDSTTITGSFNWTEAAEQRNDENLLVLRSPELARLFVGRMDFLWTYGIADTADFWRPPSQPATGVQPALPAQTAPAPVVQPSSPQVPKSSPAGDETETVYITKSGTKYHKAGCSSLAKSCIPISKKDAIARGYGPCSRCRP